MRLDSEEEGSPGVWDSVLPPVDLLSVHESQTQTILNDPKMTTEGSQLSTRTPHDCRERGQQAAFATRVGRGEVKFDSSVSSLSSINEMCSAEP